MVGRGTYGTVYKAEVRLHGMSHVCHKKHINQYHVRLHCFNIGLVALKELNFVSPTPSQFQAFRNELIALKFVLHSTEYTCISTYSIHCCTGKLHIRIRSISMVIYFHLALLL
jgi:hypothetical protein